jgi:hypothetical protein
MAHDENKFLLENKNQSLNTSMLKEAATSAARVLKFPR